MMFLDETMKAKEERDYLQNLEAGKEILRMKDFMEKQYSFGTVAFRTNLPDSPKEIYCLYKTRGEIEQTFDFLKSLLDLDHTYLQDKYAVESWAFINYVSLMLVYEIYARLKAEDILGKYSVHDFIIHLKYIQHLKINGSWVTGEISGKTQKLLDAFEPGFVPGSFFPYAGFFIYVLFAIPLRFRWNTPVDHPHGIPTHLQVP